MEFREIKTSKLKERLSRFIKSKFGIDMPPEKMIPVMRRSFTDDRLYCQDHIGAHFSSCWTMTDLWKYRETMTIEDREIHVDDRPYRKTN